MAKEEKKKKVTLADAVADLEKRIAALKGKAREKKGTAAADPALRALKKKLRRAQRRRRGLLGFARTLEARRAGRKKASAEAPPAGAPAAS